NNSRTVLVTNMSAGHHDVPGRFASLDEVALIQAFALEVTGMRRPNDALAGKAPPAAQAIAPDATSSTRSSGTDRQRRERLVEAGHAGIAPAAVELGKEALPTLSR